MASANVTNTYVVPESTKVSPYYDDFNEDKNFHRILFRPGYAVQARELTQMQTILQNQVERFGRHIFENGSPVIGGDIFLPNEVLQSLNLNPQFAGTDIVASRFRDQVLVLSDGSTNTKFKVIQTAESTTNDPPLLVGRYITPGSFSDNVTLKIDTEEVYVNTATANSGSGSVLAYLRDSIFFFNGYFVKVPAQSVIISKYGTPVNCKVGLELDDLIVTEDSDSTLLDPAQEASNYQAPGAARYQMNLVLSRRSLTSPDDKNFIELARIEDGVVKKQIKFPVYSEIEEVFARRTYDESGNYTVRPFILSFDFDKFDPFNFVRAKLTPGKAYIYGYEYETIADSEIRIPKARTKRDIVDFELNMNYGNYVIVDGLKGVFDTSTMELYDIHCVPYANINFTSNTTYQTTKIGTGRIRDLQFYSNDLSTNNRSYEFYLFDVNYRTITSPVASVTSANTLTLLNSPTLLTFIDNCYQGASLRVVSGPGRGYTYNITSYNGPSQTITVAPDFIETPTSSSNVSIDFDFEEAESFVINRSYTVGATSNANCNITVANKVGRVPTGSAYVSEPSLNNLLFPLPETYVANSISNMFYSFRKKYTEIDFNSGVSDPIVAGVNEQFLGATSSSNTSSTVMDNFLVVCVDKKVSARSNGDIIPVTVSVTSGIPEQVTFSTSNTDPNDTFSSVVFARMEFDTGVLPKLKTFIQANTKTMSAETPAYLTGWSTGSSANVYLNAGQVIISNPSRKTGVPETLYLSDVIGVKKIYDLNGGPIPDPGEILTELDDVTIRYEFDNGQKDSHYDHASIKLKPDWPACKGPLLVCCYYYQHNTVATGGGYFSVDSYPDLANQIYSDGDLLGDGYSIIPQHRRSNGDLIELRDSIDFRPVRQNASNTSPNYTLSGILPPIPTTDFQLDYSYYLGRRDLIVLNSKREFELIEGIPSKTPQDPIVPNRVMVLYSLGIPPYTEYSSNISVRYVDNRRYTMRDIGKIDKRVENLEYFVTLNNLEKKAVDMSITDVNGLERTKYGVFADSFTGHILGNSELADYKCAMNFQDGYLQCQSNTTGLYLAVNTSLSSNVTVHRDKITLNYTTKPFITQPYATKDAPVAEFLYGGFHGNIVTLPEADIWKSTNVDPDIVVTDTNSIETTRFEVYQSIVNSQSR
jgi:hypothetical protein